MFVGFQPRLLIAPSNQSFPALFLHVLQFAIRLSPRGPRRGFSLRTLFHWLTPAVSSTFLFCETPYRSASPLLVRPLCVLLSRSSFDRPGLAPLLETALSWSHPRLPGFALSSRTRRSSTFPAEFFILVVWFPFFFAVDAGGGLSRLGSDLRFCLSVPMRP